MFLENYTENGDVTGRTVIGIVSGGVGCGNNPDNKPNYPKWWARVSELKVTKNKIHNEVSPKMFCAGPIIFLDRLEIKTYLHAKNSRNGLFYPSKPSLIEQVITYRCVFWSSLIIL